MNWLKMITVEEFNKQKQFFLINSLRTEGNNLFREERYEESLKKYLQAIEVFERVEDKKFTEDIENIIRLNVAFLYIKINRPEKAIPECTKVK